MYHNHFGLKEQAFSIAVNPRYLYMSHQHKEALAHLLYGVKEGGFVMLTGEVGTGKTTIIRCLLEQLPPNTEIAIVLNPMANITELLCTICDEFGITYEDNATSVKNLTDRLQQRLLDNYKAGKSTILLIDEAQLLSAEVLEQIRLLTNLETSTKKLLQIVLVGQPELNDLLAQPRLRQLSQRITARFHLTPLTEDETDRYIKHRLSVAGMPEDKYPFSPRIVKQIHRFTGGIPRMINVLCERTLIGAYGHNKSQVDTKIFDMARREVEGNRHPATASNTQPPYLLYATLCGSAIVGLALIVFVIKLILDSGSPPPPSVAGVDATLPPAISAPATIERMGAVPSQPPSNKTAAPFDIENKLKAQAILFDYLAFEVSTETPPCWQVNAQGHHCGTIKYDTWDGIIKLNRPVVLSLVNSQKFTSHAVLIGIQNKQALLIDRDGNQQVVSLETLGPLWTGEAFYAWQKPTGFTKPLAYGDRNETVKEIASQFAVLDSQSRPLTGERFNKALRDRVKLFQREHGLEADGILGEHTLLKLNDSLGLSTPLQTDFL